MTVSIDTARAAQVAAMLDSRASGADSLATSLRRIGGEFGISGITGAAAAIASALGGELGATASVYRIRIDMASAADNGWTLAAYEHRERLLAGAMATLTSQLDDEVGSTGSNADARALIEAVVLSTETIGLVAEVPAGVDPLVWQATAITGPVLAEASPQQAADYWRLLTEDGQFAAVEYATPEVSDGYLAGTIDLSEVQIFALQAQPLLDGRDPASGPGTDWAGVTIPDVTEIVTGEGVPVAETDLVDDGELRGFLEGSAICSTIQVFSPIPSQPGSDPLNGSIAAIGVVRDIHGLQNLRTVVSGARAISPTTWAAAIADVALCRLGVGSGAAISVDRVLNEDGQMVYEGSRSPTQPYLDINGMLLSPDLEVRDRQMWNAEHKVSDGTWEPYPGYPAYEVNARGGGN